MKKIFRIIGLVAVVALIIAAIVTSTTSKPSNTDRIWDEQMTIGNLDAKNYFIIYSDLVCPYCIAFENAIVEHEDEFEQYLADNDILVEVRLSDFLYEYGQTNPIHSRHSAVATYCAKNEGKFWDYYNLAVTTVWRDFFKTSGKAAVAKMNKLQPSYWTDLGHQVGLGESFDECVATEAPLAEIEANAEKSSKLISGMPYFKFNNYVNSGYDLSWGWDYVLMYFEEGLKS